MRPRRLAAWIVALLGALLLLGTIGPTAATGSGAGLSWTAPAAIASGENLTGVACASSSLCVAVDADGNVYESQDPASGASTWEPIGQAAPAGLDTVTCPSATLCLAGGAQANIAVSTSPSSDGSFSATPITGLTGTVQAISCATTTLCFALDPNGYVASSTTPGDASSWTGPTDRVDTTGNVWGLSCPSSALCVGVDNLGSVTASTVPTSTSASDWTTASISSSLLTRVSCSSANFCVAVGDGDVASSTSPAGGASDWTTTSIPGAGTLWSIDCLSSAFCAGGDDQGDILTSTDPGSGSGADWDVANVDGTTEVTGVSCPSTDLCIAVDQAGNVLVGTPSSPGGGSSSPAWTQTPAVTPGSSAAPLYGISCTSVSDCVAVGDQGTAAGLAERWDGSTWSLENTPSISGAREIRLTSVSCPSSSLCTAAGWEYDDYGDYEPVVEQWDGSSWTVASIPNVNLSHGSSDATLNAVSCASTTSCVAVGDYTGSSYGYYAFALQWDGSSWTASSPPSPGSSYTIPTGISCASGSSSCVAVGGYSSGSGERALAADWSSSGGWSLDSGVGQGGATNNALQTVTCLSATSCVAVGSAQSYYGNPGWSGLTVQVWDGSTWTASVDGSAPGGAAGIACASTTDCLIVGSQQSTSPYTTFSEAFDGTSFTQLDTPDPGGSSRYATSVLSAVSCPGGTSGCLAAGSYQPVDGSGNALPAAPLALTMASGPFAPGLDRLDPGSGAAGGGTTVTLHGDGFAGATGVSFGGVPATSFAVADDNTITATSPDCSCSGGIADVAVTTAHGSSQTGNPADQFTYLVPPTVTSVTPATGVAGSSVEIFGTGFSTATDVSFGSESVGFTIDSATEIQVDAPSGSGTVDVTVTNSAGTSATSTSDQFAYLSVPEVDDVSPDVGADTGGTHIVIDGSGFTGATFVRLSCANDVTYDVTSFTIVSDTEIDATTPTSLYGHPAQLFDTDCDVEVQSTTGTSADTDADTFTYAQADYSSITVSETGDPTGFDDCPFTDCSLREALSEVAPGGTVSLPAGTYTLTQGQLVSSVNATIEGDTADDTTIEQTTGERVLEVSSRDLQLEHVTLTGGSTRSGGEANAGVGGGAWVNGGAELDLSYVTVSGNHAYQSGGGIDVNGTLRADHSTISGNSVAGGYGIGGGIDDFGAFVDVENSTIADNSAATQGGGMLLASGATLLNDTFAGNTAPDAASVYVYGGADIQTTNTILDSSGSDNCDAPLDTQGHNLSTDASCWSGGGATGDLTSTDPGLGSLAANGGETETLEPAASSPAVDAGDDAACPADDQIDTSRPQGAHCDIGSIEVAQAPVSANLDVTVSGTGSVTSDVTGIDCPGTCTATFSTGTVVTLTATPGTGQAFTGWSGACAGTAACVVTLSADTSVTATFAAAAAAQPELHIDGAQQIASGSSAREPIVVENTVGPLAGPVTLAVTLPSGHAKVAKVAAGWSCPTVSSSLVVCTTAGTLDAGANVTALTLTLSATGLAAGSTMTLSAELDNGTYTADTSQTVKVTPAQVPMLSVGIQQALSVVDTQGGVAVVDVSNVGHAPTSAGDTVAIGRLDGALVSAAAGTGWTCSGVGAAGTVTCTQSGTALPGTRLPALALRFSSTDASTAQVVVSAVASDRASLRSATGAGVVELLHTTAPVLALRTTLPPGTRVAPGDTLRYALVVANTGTAPENGDVEVTYSYPAGTKVTATPAGDSGWTCRVTALSGQPVSLVCVRPPSFGALAPGKTSPQVVVAARLPATLGAGTIVLSGHASSGMVTLAGVRSERRLSITVPSGTFPQASPETSDDVDVTSIEKPTLPPPAPDGIAIHTTVGNPSSSSSAPLQRGEPGYLVVNVTNTSGSDQPHGTAIGLQLPVGIAPHQGLAAIFRATGQPVASKPKKQPVISCTHPAPGTKPTTVPYLCTDSADLPAGQGFEVSIEVDVDPNAQDTLNVRAGVMAAKSPTLEDVSAGSFQGQTETLPLSVSGLKAVAQLAGEPGSTTPEVASLVRKADTHGNPNWQPNTITLDGSQSTGSGTGELTYVWAQLSGGAVTPVGAAGTRPALVPVLISPPAGATLFYGEQPQVTLPAVQATGPQPFVFELFVSDGSRVSSTTTTVNVDPAPEQPPVIAGMEADTGGTTLAKYVAPAELFAPGYGHNADVTTPHAQPAPVAVQTGQCVTVTAGGHSPSGATLSWAFAVDAPADPPTPVPVGNGTSCPAGSGNTYSFAWPAGYSLLLVSATASDGLGGTVTHTLAVGSPPAPLTLTAALPAGFPSAGAGPGTQVTLTATAHGGDPSSIVYSWATGACSGGGGAGVTIVSTNGATAVVAVPAAKTAGSSVSVCATATQGGENAGSASATVQIPLAAPAGLQVTAAAGSSSLATGATTSVTATASGGAAPYSYTWSAVAGSLTHTGANATYTAPATAGADTVTVVVKDAAGSTASYSLPLTIGSASAPSAQGCASDGLVAQALAAAASHVPLSVTMGWGTASLGTLSGSVDCSAGTGTISFSNGSFAIAGGLLSGTGLSGTITVGTSGAPSVCLTGGSLSLPASWGLQPATVPSGQPLCLNGNRLSGSPGGFASGAISFPGAPFLRFGSANAPTTTLTFDGTSIDVSATGPLLGGTATLTGSYSAATGTTSLAASLTGATALGLTLGQVNGSLTVPASGAPTYSLTAAASGPATLVPGVVVQNGTVTLDNNGLSVTAAAQIGPSGHSVAVALNGTFTDSQHWSLALSGNQSASCSSWSGTTVDLGCLQFLGTVKANGGSPVFSASASLSKWNVTTFLTVQNLTVQLANDTAPAACTPPKTPQDQTPVSVVASGDLYLAVTGSGTLQLPGLSPMPVSGAACIDLGSGGDFLVDAHAGDWQPVANVDATLVSADVDVLDEGGTVTVGGTGQANIAGVTVNASLGYDTSTDDFVLDGYGSLSSLVPGVPGSAHAIFATETTPGYKLFDGSSATPSGTVDLAADSLTVAIAFGLPNPADSNSGPVGKVLKQLGFNGPTSVVVAAQISSSGFTLIGSLQTNAVIFGLCKNPSGNVTMTRQPTQSCLSLSLQDLFVELSSDGTLGFGADTLLNIPDPSSSGSSADLDLRMEMAVQLPAKVTASFEVKGVPSGPNAHARCSVTTGSYTDAKGDWCNALFVGGLDINTFAIQGSIDFSTGIPTPNIGFFASGIVLPSQINNLLGIQNDGETMTFGMNISATAPVLDIELGQADGHAFLKPLQAISAVSSAVEVDDADLVFAPLGGQLGGVALAPGLGLSFDADFFGDVVHASAQIGLSPKPSVTADVHVDELPLPQFGVVLMNVDLELGFGAGISGPPAPTVNAFSAPCASSIGSAVPQRNHAFTGFYFAGSGSVGLIPGAPTACLALGVRIDSTGISLAGGGSIDNWTLGPVIGVTHLGMTVAAGPIQLGSDTLDSSIDDLVPSVTVSAHGAAVFLGATATLQGNVSLGAGGITAADLTLGVQQVSYAGLQIGADQSASCPSIVTGANLGSPSSSGGPFVQVDYTGGGNWAAAFSGSVGFEGVSASGCGQVSPGGVSFNGLLNLNRLLNASVNVSGAFYWGTPQPGQLVVTDSPCTSGTLCVNGWTEQQAHQGDWYLAVGASTNTSLGGFALSATFGAGSANGALYLHGKGSLSVGSQSNGAALTGYLEAHYTNGSLSYELDAAGKVVLDGYTITQVQASLTPQRLALAGQVSIGGANVTLAGTVVVGSGQLSASCNFSSSIPGYSNLASDPSNDVGTANGGTAFCFYASVSNLSLFGGTLNGSAVLSNAGFKVNGTYNFPLGVGQLNVNGGIYSDGTLAATVSTGFTLFGASISGTVGLCAGNCQADAGVDQGVWFDANANLSGWGDLVVKGSFTNPGSFSLSANLSNQGGTLGPVNVVDLVLVGGTVSYDIGGSISQNGFSLSNLNVSLSVWYETPTISVSWSNGVTRGWSDPSTLASIGAVSSGNEECVSGSIAGIVTVPSPWICA